MNELSREQYATYTLLVQASDGGEPSLSNTTTVTIHVTVPDNAPPKFKCVCLFSDECGTICVDTHIILCTIYRRQSDCICT